MKFIGCCFPPKFVNSGTLLMFPSGHFRLRGHSSSHEGDCGSTLVPAWFAASRQPGPVPAPGDL